MKIMPKFTGFERRMTGEKIAKIDEKPREVVFVAKMKNMPQRMQNYE